jgi:transposase-like protein
VGSSGRGGCRPAFGSLDDRRARAAKELERENRELRRANEILKAASAFSRRSSTRPGRSGELCRDAHRPRFGVEPICRTLGIASSTFYARKTRPPSRRRVEDGPLLTRIRSVHEHNYGAYGSRRVWKALRRQGVPVARCRVERLMRQHRLRGAQPGRKRRWLTVPDETAPRPTDLVERRFVADRPNQLWVCDLTYLKETN